MTEAKHKLADASFRIAGDTLVPEEWSAYFGLTATEAGRKGDLIRPDRTYRFRTGIWTLKSSVMSDGLEHHLFSLIDDLMLPRSDLAQKLREADCKADMFCYWDNEAGDRVPSVRATLMDVLTEHEIALEIDEYPQKVLFCQSGVRKESWV